MANLISLPMTFLSGVFFPREAMPDVLQRITDFLPLTYLADALRKITNDGAGVAAWTRATTACRSAAGLNRSR